MGIFAKKTTKVYKDGKLVNTIESNMSKKKYYEDLGKTVTSANYSGDKIKFKPSGSDDAAIGKVSGYKHSFFRSLGNKQVKYTYDATYKYPKQRKGRRK